MNIIGVFFLILGQASVSRYSATVRILVCAKWKGLTLYLYIFINIYKYRYNFELLAVDWNFGCSTVARDGKWGSCIGENMWGKIFADIPNHFRNSDYVEDTHARKISNYIWIFAHFFVSLHRQDTFLL
jgi:hypothetical protein